MWKNYIFFYRDCDVSVNSKDFSDNEDMIYYLDLLSEINNNNDEDDECIHAADELRHYFENIDDEECKNEDSDAQQSNSKNYIFFIGFQQTEQCSFNDDFFKKNFSRNSISMQIKSAINNSGNQYFYAFIKYKSKKKNS